MSHTSSIMGNCCRDSTQPRKTEYDMHEASKLPRLSAADARARVQQDGPGCSQPPTSIKFPAAQHHRRCLLSYYTPSPFSSACLTHTVCSVLLIQDIVLTIIADSIRDCHWTSEWESRAWEADDALRLNRPAGLDLLQLACRAQYSTALS